MDTGSHARHGRHIIAMAILLNLVKYHRNVHTEFMKGTCVVKKSNRAFSATAIGQAHEQSIKKSVQYPAGCHIIILAIRTEN